MDNLSAHKAPTVRQSVEAAGARLFYLPPYAPDLNPLKSAGPSSSKFFASSLPKGPQRRELGSSYGYGIGRHLRRQLPRVAPALRIH
jgi:hypothetical protein